MCDTNVENKKFCLKAGSRIDIDGTPYWLVSDVEVNGFEEPRFPVFFDEETQSSYQQA
jgi:hypothetical protein